MKDQFLKLAGVKSEKEFYKLFPSEEAFMAKHGKALAKLNKEVPKNQNARFTLPRYDMPRAASESTSKVYNLSISAYKSVSILIYSISNTFI